MLFFEKITCNKGIKGRQQASRVKKVLIPVLPTNQQTKKKKLKSYFIKNDSQGNDWMPLSCSLVSIVAVACAYTKMSL